MPVFPVSDLMLEAVIAHEQVELAFQPLVDARSGRIVAVETLARCAIASGPEHLFARAASARLAERLSRLVQRKALRSAARWEGPLKALPLSINVLAADIGRSGYDGWLLGEIEAAGIAPGRIILEITENALLGDDSAVRGRLQRLRDAGIRIAIDDFGTGFSSFAYLTTLPLDWIKIDRALVSRIVDEPRDQIVVRSLLKLSAELGLTSVVEGVESAAQLALLEQWGCDLYQGYCHSAPLDDAGLMELALAA